MDEEIAVVKEESKEPGSCGERKSVRSARRSDQKKDPFDKRSYWIDNESTVVHQAIESMQGWNGRGKVYARLYINKDFMATGGSSRGASIDTDGASSWE